ncbi:methyltransferase [Streptomyces avicenniae]|uniref:methyltransferase n=1 Tax=Streptomyces avicenniae TaxID=500153 RepID=UPI00069B6589|nr:methyltransferase [Streptomyces avicenniae]
MPPEPPVRDTRGPAASGSRTALRTDVVRDALRQVLADLSERTGRPVLDVLDTGGGSGSFAVPLAALGHRVTVVDPSPDALFALGRRAAEKGVADRVRGVQGDTQDLHDVLGDVTFDMVLCHGVLEYLDDPAAGLRAVARALRPDGGVLSLLAAGLGGAVLSRALAGRFTEARRALEDPAGRWGDADPVPHRFTPDRLTALADGAGLAVLGTQGVRVFADLVPGALVDTGPDALAQLARLEAEAAALPAFQAIAGQLHLLAVRGGPQGELRAPLLVSSKTSHPA